MSEEVKVWSVVRAARYREGILLEEFDNSYSSDMRPFMVAVEDYNALRSRLDSVVRMCDEVIREAGMLGADAVDHENAHFAETVKALLVEKRPEVQGVKWLSLEEMKERYPNEGSDVERQPRYRCETERVKCDDCGEIITPKGYCGCPDIGRPVESQER